MQLQTNPKQRYYTPEEYLELEEKSQEKNEYRNGEIIQIVGGTTNHNQIAGNVYKLFPLNIDDQGDKFEYYRSLPTFQEYILIEQDRYSITQYIKQDHNNWLVNFYTGEDAILKLGSVNWEISLKDIYQRIDFEAVEEDS